MATRSMAADRCTATLDGVFQRLPAWMRNGQQNPSISKKRPYEQHSQGPAPMASRSHPYTPLATQDAVQAAKRASTYPKIGVPGTSGTSGATSPYESSWSQSGSPYGPQTPTTSSFDTNGFPGMAQRSVTHPLSNGMQQYPTLPNVANPQLTDLSTMMFPTADEPFVYPNQPLTTFENNQYAKNQAYMNSAVYNGIDGTNQAPAPTARGPEENIEAQFYALPPYMEQGVQQQHSGPSQTQAQTRTHIQQPQQRNMGFSQPMAYTRAQPGATVQAMQMPNGNWPQAFQQDISNINIQDLFGGAEWSPMFQHGYQGSR